MIRTSARLVAAILVAAAATGCSQVTGGDARHARVGDVFELNAEAEGRPLTVQLPNLRYELVASRPLARARHQVGEYDDGWSAEPAPGAEFLEIGYRPAKTEGDAWALWRPSPRGDLPDPVLTVVADGERIVLDNDLRFDWLVAVPADADELALEAEFDGRTLRTDLHAVDSGIDVFEGTPPRRTSVPCPEQPRTELRGGVEFNGTECGVTALTAVPWHVAVGWAAPGRAWLVAQVRIGINTYFSAGEAGDADYEIGYGEPVYRLDGALPHVVLDEDGVELASRPDDMTVDDVRTVVFDVPADATDGTLELAMDYTGTPEDGEGQRVRFRLRRSLPLALR
ncbi:hypothetical protein [Pimelobacter simplex]|uniref:hypothetical protein n=1 Tax=Nocardioides simplex TaxID=2045 RepID=UPI0019329D9C|nr:hypothetical protein [Pimelobacter simplex]